MDNSKFEQTIQRFSSSDEMEYENAYLALLDNVDHHLDDLIELMQVTEDPVLRGKYIEVLGASDNSKLIPIFSHELNSEHSEVRMWAFFQLSRFDSAEAWNRIESYIKDNPDDEWIETFF